MRKISASKYSIGLLLVGVLLSVSAQAQLPNPTALYPLDGTAIDASGNGLNGTINNATPTLDRCGNANSAFRFNGINASITMSLAAEFDIPVNGAYTISAWIRPESNGVAAIFVKCPFAIPWTNGIWDYGMYGIFGQLMAGAGATGHVLTGPSNLINNGCWSHVVSTYDNGNWKTYINGVLEASDLSQTRFITQSTGGMAIGKKGDSNGDFFDGAIDDLAFYDVALTDAQVTSLYNDQKVDLGSVNNTFNVCPGDPVQLELTTSCASFPAGSISWAPGVDLSATNIFDPVATTSASRNYQGRMTIQNCVHSTNVSINVDPLEVIDFGPDTTMCADDTLFLDALNAGATYLWQDNSTDRTFDVTIPGTYWVEAVTPNGCSTRDTITVMFVTPMSDPFGNDTTLCDGATLLLDALNPGSTYQWQDNSTAQTLMVADTGLYWAAVVTPNGCMVRDSIYVDYIEPTDGVLGNDTVLCPGATLTLDAQNSGSGYVWQDNSTNQTFAVSIDGQYHVEITAFNGCVDHDTINVSYVQLEPNFEVFDTMGCEPFVTIYENTTFSTDPFVSYAWDLANGSMPTTASTKTTYTSSNTYLVSLTVTTALGCVETFSRPVNIEVYPQPEADFSVTTINIFANQPVQLTDESTDAIYWTWDFGNEDGSTDQNPDYNYLQPGDYTVTLIASTDFCADTASLDVTVNQTLTYYVPNAFSPNGDQLNDDFTPVFTAGFDPESYHLMIFNRWGESVFESFDHTIGWDGTVNGNKAPGGVYIYTIDFKELYANKKIAETGHVTVLR